MARAHHELGTLRELTGADAELHRDHLLRLDAEGRRERFNGVADDRFIDRYSRRCFSGRTRVFALPVGPQTMRRATDCTRPAESPRWTLYQSSGLSS